MQLNKFINKKVLITGAAGFIGRNILETFHKNNIETILPLKPETNPWRISRLNKLKIKYANLLDLRETLNLFETERPDYIFHLASIGGHPTNIREFQEHIINEIKMTSNLLEASKEIGIKKFIFGGSSLDSHIIENTVFETNCYSPRTFRGISKATSSILCTYYANYESLNVINAKIFSVYGPWEQPSRFIPKIITQFLNKGTIPLINKKYKRDFIHVNDVVNAFISISLNDELKPGSIINIGSGNMYTAWDVYDILCDIFNYRIDIEENEYLPKFPDKTPYKADLKNSVEILNWKPELSLQEGMKETVLWFKKHYKFYEELSN